jgi:hypothetical protein
MIFRQWQQVLDGTKTQTRRLVKPNELASGNRPRRWIHAVWIDTKGVHDRRHEQHGFIRAPLVILESLYRLKWAVAKSFFADKTYAIQPGRGKPAIWWRPDGTATPTPLDEYLQKSSGIRETWGPKVKRWLQDHGYTEARIRITKIRREYLQEITVGDIFAEGVPAVPLTAGRDAAIMMAQYAFCNLWNSIHKKPGTRFEDNPECWVLTIERVENG